MLGRKRFSILLAGSALVALVAGGCANEGDDDRLVPVLDPPSRIDDMGTGGSTSTGDDVNPPGEPGGSGSPGDFDDDGTADGEDNCPVEANEDQGDVDGDGVGDVCDDCPTIFNPEQSDSDEDGRPDDCEGDEEDPDGGPIGGDGDPVGGVDEPEGLNLPDLPIRSVDQAPPIK